ncbi:MAG: hypothetical protein R6V07_00580, partial [Armatimonadota bacterium]
ANGACHVKRHGSVGDITGQFPGHGVSPPHPVGGYENARRFARIVQVSTGQNNTPAAAMKGNDGNRLRSIVCL